MVCINVGGLWTTDIPYTVSAHYSSYWDATPERVNSTGVIET